MPIGITRKKIIHPNANLGNPPRQSTFRPTFLQSCYQCGQKGHYKRNCPEIFCFYCSRPGHVKKCCSFYSSYLQTKSSSSSVISQPLDTKQQKINNFEIINKKKNEEERVPQKLDHLLEKKDFTAFQDRISQTIKALELSFSELKKVVDFQKKQILDVITRVGSLEVYRIEINPKLLKLADRIQTIEPTVDELLIRVNRVEEGLDINGLQVPGDFPTGNRGRRGRGGYYR